MESCWKGNNFNLIGGACRLRCLHVSDVRIVHLGWLRDLPLLEEVSLVLCEVEDLISSGRLKRLRVLDVQNTQVRDYSWTRSLTALQYICFSRHGFPHIRRPGNVEPYQPMLEE